MRHRTGAWVAQRPWLEWAACGASLLAVAAGFTHPETAPIPWLRAFILALPPGVLLGQSVLHAGGRGGSSTHILPAALLSEAAVLTQVTGGLAGPGASALALGAVLASLTGSLSGAGLWTSLSALSLAVAELSRPAPAPVGHRAAFVLFALLCALVPAQAHSVQRRQADRLRARLRAVEDESGSLLRESREALPELRDQVGDGAARERELRAIARQLQEDIERACAILHSTTGATSVVVYRPDGGDTGDRLVATAMGGDRSRLRTEVGAQEGLIGAVLKSGTPVAMRDLRPDEPRLTHRLPGAPPAAVLALPLQEGTRRWGVVVLDLGDKGDEPRAREVGGVISDFVSHLIARAIDLRAVREGLHENHAFFQACREVARHVRIEQVADAVTQGARDITGSDACAFALADERGEKLTVLSSVGFSAEVSAATFPLQPNEGLLAQAVRHRTPLLRATIGDGDRPPLLFGRGSAPVAGLRSIIVLPVQGPGEGASPLGALVVARRALPGFDADDESRLSVLLAQAGASIANGRLFAEHERRSITDGMTGLPNHRRFQEVLANKIARSQRTGSEVSLLLLDIDRFKSVNDRYGHPMGDEVIRRLARVLGDAVRDGTDLAARYGGEEFCVLLEDTPCEGATVLANRIREAWKQEVFVHTTEGRPSSFHCSVSIGVATWPADAKTQQQLIDHADQALYASKSGGRDRVTAWRRLEREAAAS